MEVSSWENHLFLWAIYTMAMLNNKSVIIMIITYLTNNIINKNNSNNNNNNDNDNNIIIITITAPLTSIQKNKHVHPDLPMISQHPCGIPMRWGQIAKSLEITRWYGWKVDKTMVFMEFINQLIHNVWGPHLVDTLFSEPILKNQPFSPKARMYIFIVRIYFKYFPTTHLKKKTWTHMK